MLLISKRKKSKFEARHWRRQAFRVVGRS